LYAQTVDPKVINNYPQDVVVKVYQVMSKVNLSPAQQLKLATYFKSQDALVLKAIATGKSKKYVDSLHAATESGLERLLNPEQLVKYSIAPSDTPVDGVAAAHSTVFAFLLNNAKQLNLSKPQTDSLTAAIIAVAKLKQGKNQQDFEQVKMTKILTAQQYESYLQLKNSGKALKWATSDWADIKAHGLDKGLDSAKVVNQILQYDINRLVAKDKFRNDPAQLDVYIRNIDASKPMILKQLRASKNNGNPTGKQAAAVKADYVW
jgi:hypothetical protein